LALYGETALVGAYGDEDSGLESGSAYVFRHDGVSWVQEQKLLATDGSELDLFGFSVALRGNLALVSAHGDDDSGDRAGSAYVFRHNGVTWVQEQKLLATDGAAEDLFGFSVALSEGLALIGAYWDGDSGFRSGSAYVFRYTGASWVQEQKLLASDGSTEDYFGYSVASNGDLALIGAFGDDDSGSFAGSAYVFRHDGVAWLQERKLLAADGATFDGFGYSVALGGELALVGATAGSGAVNPSGSAYLFDLANGPDCNANGLNDRCDLLAGTSLDANANEVPDECDSAAFRRGDCGGSGASDVSDSIFLLGSLFGLGAAPGCADACDSNDDGGLDIADAVHLLAYLFGGGASPPAPGNFCGHDPGPADPLGCDSFGGCP